MQTPQPWGYSERKAVQFNPNNPNDAQIRLVSKSDLVTEINVQAFFFKTKTNVTWM